MLDMLANALSSVFSHIASFLPLSELILSTKSVNVSLSGLKVSLDELKEYLILFFFVVFICYEIFFFLLYQRGFNCIQSECIYQ